MFLNITCRIRGQQGICNGDLDRNYTLLNYNNDNVMFAPSIQFGDSFFSNRQN